MTPEEIGRATHRIELRIPIEQVSKALRPESVPVKAKIDPWKTQIVGGDQRDPKAEELVIAWVWDEEYPEFLDL
jgi:hypothetical protein